MDEDALNFQGESLPDDDPDVLAGMERLKLLRESDDNVPDTDEERSRRRN